MVGIVPCMVGVVASSYSLFLLANPPLPSVAGTYTLPAGRGHKGQPSPPPPLEWPPLGETTVDCDATHRTAMGDVLHGPAPARPPQK